MISDSGPSRRRAFLGRGVTLIEMLVLIIIMAILAGMIIPAHARHLASVRFDQAVTQTVTMLASARQRALDSGTAVSVTADLQNGTWVVQPDATATTGPTADPSAAPVQTDAPVALSDEDATAAALTDTRTTQLPEDVMVTQFQVDSDQNQQGAQAVSQDSRNGQALHFYEDGSSDGCKIEITSADGHRAMLEVSALTGLAALVPDDDEMGGGQNASRR